MEEVQFGQIQPLIFGKRQFRAPFKIDFSVWCPRAELLVIASKKGDVVLKRSGWKKCWRISVHELIDPLSGAEPEAPRTISCISWNPLGDIIAVGMSDGHIYLINADSGTVFWKKLISDPSGTPIKIARLTWGSKHYEPKPALEDKIPVGELRTNEDQPWIANLKTVEEIFRTKLYFSYLFVLRDDLKISVLAAGALTIGVIDLEALLGPWAMAPFVLYDAFFASRENLSIAVTTFGPAPNCSGTEPTKGEGQSCLQTHIVNCSIETKWDVWKGVARYVDVYSRWFHIEESLQKILKDWQTHKQIFINRLVPSAKNLSLGPCLVSFCLSGQGTPLGDAYSERSITANMTGLIEFLYNSFDQLIASLNGEFSEAVRSASFELERLSEAMETIFLGEWEARHQDTPLYNSLKNLILSLQTLSPSFQKTAAVTVRACVDNIGDLLQFIKWLSILPKEEKLGKKKLAVFPQLAKLDLSSELKYLIETFIEDEEMAANLKENIFDIDGIIAREKKKEDEGYYKRKAEEERKNKTPESNPNGRSQLMEDGTPVIEKTSVFKKIDSKSGTEWQEKIDRVSELWTTAADFSDDLLTRLGLNTEANKNLPNIKKQCENLRKLLSSVDSTFEHFLAEPQINWMCELGSGASHEGFTVLELGTSAYDFHSTLESGGLEFLRDITGSNTVLLEPIIVTAHDKRAAYFFVLAIKPDLIAENPLPTAQNTVWTELTRIVRIGSHLGPGKENETDSDGLTVNTGQIGEITEILGIERQEGGLFYVLVNVDAFDGTTVRRLLRCEEDKSLGLCVHEASFRPDQFETMSFMRGNVFACFISDDSTRANIFTITPDIGRKTCSKFDNAAMVGSKTRGHYHNPFVFVLGPTFKPN